MEQYRQHMIVEFLVRPPIQSGGQLNPDWDMLCSAVVISYLNPTRKCWTNFEEVVNNL